MPTAILDKPRVILVLGIPGVGKTTVLEEAYNAARKMGAQIGMVTFSDIMLKRAKSERLASHRDEMRNLPPDTQLRLQKEAAEEVASMTKYEIVLVDTHALIRVSEKVFLPGVPSSVAKILAPQQVIHIEATAEEIMSRRYGDTSERRRDVEMAEQVNLHQTLSQSASLAIATQTGALLRIINNREGELLATAKRLSESILS